MPPLIVLVLEHVELVVHRADFGLTLLLYAAMFVLSDLLSPKPKFENAKPAALGDFQVPTATEGRSLPMLWGMNQIKGPNVVWYGDLIQEAITKEVKTGLFSSKNVTTGFRYYLGMQMVLAGGECDELTRVWIGDDLVFEGNVTHGGTFTINKPDLFGGEELGQGGVVGTMQFFAGTPTQTAAPYLVGKQVISGKTPRYLDTAYVVPATTPTYLGNSTSIKPWKFETRRTPNPLGLTGNRHKVNGSDMNPATALYLALTETEEGLGFNTATINDANFIVAGNTLFDEGNGYTHTLDRTEDIGDLIRRIEDQIDGIVYQNPTTGLWEIALIRDDYDPLTIPELDDTNVDEVNGFTWGTWEGTKNQVRTPFVDRDDEYKDTYGFAQDMANMRIVGRTTSTSITHPGVKDGDLANALAWRAIRTLAIPLAKADFVVNRTLYGVKPGDVVAYTNAELNLNRLPMRVRKVDYGSLLDGRITLSCVQDVFRSSPGSFAPPPPTTWQPPTDTLVAFPVDEQLAFEAPRGLTLRDPELSSPTVDRIFVAARRQGPEAMFRVLARHSSGTPAGTFAEIGSVYGFARIGSLLADLPVGSAYPLTTLTIAPSPDTQSALETAFPDITDLVDLGTELITLCLVDDEFFLVSSAQNSGLNVQLQNVYRGVLDSAQAHHTAGAPVFLLFLGAGMSAESIAAGQNVHVKLIPRSISDELAEGSATQIAFSMANRTRRPYPPSELSINGTRFDPTVSLEGGAGVGENIGIDLSFVRRDFRTTDEIASLLDDAGTLDPTFPAANTTTHEVDVYDVSGAPVLLFTQALGAGTTGSVRRLDVLEATDGVVPSDLRFVLRATHTFEGTTYDSRYTLDWEFALSSALSALFAFGALDTGDVSAAFTVAAAASNHVFTLSSAFSAGAVEYRLNGGAWTNLITAGGTSGTILSGLLTNGDTIQIRHASTDPGAQKLITMAAGSNAAFGVLFV